MHPVLVSFWGFSLYSYGFLISLGAAASLVFWLSRREKMGLKREEDVWLLLNAILAGGILGGRALHLLQYERPFTREFWEAAFALRSGFSVMGAMAGIPLGIYWVSRRVKVPFLRLLDYACQASAFAHCLGRLGCFAAGCCYGRPASVPWAVTFRDPASAVGPALLGVPLHPTQLYEALGDVVLGALLYFLVLPRIEDGRLARGTLAAFYFAGYAAMRFLNEYFRGDVIPLGWGLTQGQAFCLLQFAAASSLWVYVSRKPCTLR
jgi:phosphatidylglycerol:prolipoprotein diacylglycerol transferase